MWGVSCAFTRCCDSGAGELTEDLPAASQPSTHPCAEAMNERLPALPSAATPARGPARTSGSLAADVEPSSPVAPGLPAGADIASLVRSGRLEAHGHDESFDKDVSKMLGSIEMLEKLRSGKSSDYQLQVEAKLPQLRKRSLFKRGARDEAKGTPADGLDHVKVTVTRGVWKSKAGTCTAGMYEAVLPCRLTQLVTMWREVDLAATWCPFMEQCQTQASGGWPGTLYVATMKFPLFPRLEFVSQRQVLDGLASEEPFVLVADYSPPPGTVGSWREFDVPPPTTGIRPPGADVLLLLTPCGLESTRITLFQQLDLPLPSWMVPLSIFSAADKTVARKFCEKLLGELAAWEERDTFAPREKADTDGYYGEVQARVEAALGQEVQARVEAVRGQEAVATPRGSSDPSEVHV